MYLCGEILEMSRTERTVCLTDKILALSGAAVRFVKLDVGKILSRVTFDCTSYIFMYSRKLWILGGHEKLSFRGLFCIH